MKKHHPLLLQSILLLSILVIGGCTDFAPMVRKVTYPPDFKYVDGKELRTQMNQLAFQLQSLDMVLAGTSSTQHSQQQVLKILSNIEDIGSGLQASNGGTNHPFLQNFMNDFVAEVAQAKIAASFNSPNYYFAGKIAGGCVNCHEINRK